MRDTDWVRCQDPDGEELWQRVREGAIFTVQRHPADSSYWTCGVIVPGRGFLTLRDRGSKEDAMEQADTTDIEGYTRPQDS